MPVLRSDVQFYIDSRWSGLIDELSARKTIGSGRFSQNYDGYFEGVDGTNYANIALSAPSINIENGLTYMILYKNPRNVPAAPATTDIMYFQNTVAGETIEYVGLATNQYFAKQGADAGNYSTNLPMQDKSCVGFTWKPSETVRFYADGAFETTPTACPWNATTINVLQAVYTSSAVSNKIRAVILINRKCTDVEMAEIQASLEKGEPLWSDYVGLRNIESRLSEDIPFYTSTLLNDMKRNGTITAVAGSGAVTKLIGRKGYSLTLDAHLNLLMTNAIGNNDYTISFMMRIPPVMYSVGGGNAPILSVGLANPGEGFWIISSDVDVSGGGTGIFFYYHSGAVKIGEYSQLNNGRENVFTITRKSGTTSFFINGDRLSTTSAVASNIADKNIKIGHFPATKNKTEIEILDFKLWNGTALTSMQVWNYTQEILKNKRFDR